MTLNQEYKSYQTVAQRDASRLQLIRRPATHGAAPPLSTHHPLPCPRLTPTHRSKNPFLIHMFTLRPKEQLTHPNSLSSPQSRHTLPCLPPVHTLVSPAPRTSHHLNSFPTAHSHAKQCFVSLSTSLYTEGPRPYHENTSNKPKYFLVHALIRLVYVIIFSPFKITLRVMSRKWKGSHTFRNTLA